MPLCLCHLLCFMGGYWSMKQMRHPCPVKGRTGGAYSVKPNAVMPKLPSAGLMSCFFLLCFTSQFFTLLLDFLSILLFLMSCFTSAGKIGMLKCGYVSANGVFWQISYGTVSELCPSTATASLEALFSSLWCTQLYVPLSFLGGDVLMVVGFERCHRIVWRSCSVLGFWEDCHLNLLLIDTLLSLKTWNQFLTQFLFEVQNFLTKKAFDTEILSLLEMVEESLAGKARVVDWFFSSCCWEAKNIVLSTQVIQCRVIKMLEEKVATCIQNTLQLWLPRGFCQPSWLMVAPGR